jgi:hypothetical protein
MRAFRCAALALCGVLGAQQALATCYVVYGPDDQVLYRSTEPPVDLPWTWKPRAWPASPMARWCSSTAPCRLNGHRQRQPQEEQLGTGHLTAIHRESSQRVHRLPALWPARRAPVAAARCSTCMAAQVAVKQRVLEDNLWHLGKVKPITLLRPIEGPAWGYRYRARLSVRHVHKKGVVLVGFHERKSRYVADMSVCPVLPPHVSAMLLPLRALIAGMDARDTCPQIELACGDDVTALVLRHLEPLSTRTKPLARVCDGPPQRAMVAAAQRPGHGSTARRTAWTVCHRCNWRTRCQTLASPCRSSRPTSPRSTRTSTACWSAVRCGCWMRSATSASSTGSAAWATSRCPGHAGARGAGH